VSRAVDILKVPGRIVTGAASAGPIPAAAAAGAPAAAPASAPASAGVPSAAALDALSPLAAGAANPAGLAEQQQEGSALAAPDNSLAGAAHGSQTAGQPAKRPADPSENPHYYVWSDRMSRARVYADVNTKRPREYWDYESLSINWGCVALTDAAGSRVQGQGQQVAVRRGSSGSGTSGNGSSGTGGPDDRNTC
jgi:hypothetical protein